MKYLLVDNGTLAPASYLNLRRLAGEVSERVGATVEAVSLLHSSKIDPAELGGEPALTWEHYMKTSLEAGEIAFSIIPFFIGPTRALMNYMPERLARLRERYGVFSVCRGPFLFNGDAEIDIRLAQIAAENVRHCIERKGLDRPPVVLVDHGSPVASVAYVRNYLAGQVSLLLGGEVARVGAASMERREGAEYAFNEPLLEDRLRQAGYNEGDVVVGPLFLSPGRHAGDGGDVAQICERAEEDQAGLRCHRADLLGTHPLMVDLLVERFRALKSTPVYL